MDIDIAIDFDGTVVTHAYPNIGEDIGAVPVLKSLVKNGNRLLLNTMRSGKTLEEAIQWFKANHIPLAGVNINPGQSSWTDSPKVYAQLYIDDCGLNAPLKFDPTTGRTYIDWKEVKKLLIKRGVL